MTLVFKDRVKQKTTTVGSGDLTLIGVDADFQSFSQIGDGNDTYYTIASQNEWEVGVGTYNPSGVSSSWVQLGSDIDGEDTGDASGQSVSLSDDGTILAIGAVYNDDGPGNDAGHVRVYELSDQVWVQKGSDIDGETAGDWSGYSVSLNGDGTILAIGAIYNDDAGSNAGHVRIYEWSGSSWVQKGSKIDGEAAADESGYSVSLNHDGTVVAIGAPDNDDGPGSDAGHVRVYEWNGSAWTQKGGDIDGDSSGDLFGGSVDINDDGTVVIAGAVGGDGNGLNSGELKVYEWNGSAWAQKGSTLSGESVLNSFGSSVSINNDGSVIAVGAERNDGTGQWAGHVRVFYWDGSDWDQRGDDIDGEALQDYSGTQTVLNGDGTVVAIGARDNEGTGTDAGHVRVYGWNGSAWVQLGADIDAEAAEDESGKAVAISDDGTIVAIGARLNDGGGTDAGHVRTFVRATLSRNTVLESSNLGNKISTTGTSTVFCTYPAEKSVYRNTNDQIVATASGIIFSDDSVQTTSPTLQTVTDLGSNTTNSIVTSGNVTASTGIFDGGIQLVGALASVVSDLTELGDVNGVWFNGKHDNAASGLTLGFNFPGGNHYYSTIRTIANNDISGTRNRSLLLDCDTRKDTSNSSELNSVCMVNAHNNQASLSNANLFGVYNAGDEKFVVTSSGSLRIASGIIFSDDSVQTSAAASLAGSGLTLNGATFDANVASAVQTTAPNSITTTADKTYSIQVNSSDDLVVNVPWVSGSGGSDGDITSVVAGSGLSGGGTTGDVTLNVSGVNTDLLQGTVANNQLANSSVTITAGTGLSNGGSVALGGSVSIDIDSSVMQTGDNVSLLTNDAGYLTAYSETGTLQTVTDNGSTTSNAITINDNLTAEKVFADLDGPIVLECKNTTGSQINAGTPVYVSGYFSGNGKALISPAIGNNSSKMPAIGLLESNLSDDTEGNVHIFGLATGFDTSSFSVGETIYVAATGGLTNTRPTGVSDLVQNMGRVLRSDASQGRILLLGPGRSNDVPNSGNFTELTVDNISVLTAHPSISAASSVDNSARTYIQDLTLDSNGHVTAIVSAAETVTDTNTTYTAGSGLQLNSTTFDALTASTSASGITILTNTIDSTQTKALTPKAVHDAGYMSSFILEDGDGTEVTIANGKEVKFVEGNGIDIDWTDTDNGTDADPYDLTFTVDHDAASNFVANEHIDHTSVTLTAGDGLTGGGDISANRSFAVSVDDSTIETNSDSLRVKAGGIGSAQIADDAINSEHYAAGSIDLEHMSSQSVDEDNLHISNTGNNGQFLSKQSGNDGGLTWATPTDTNTTYTAGTGITLNGTEFDIDPTLISGRTEITSADADYLLVWDADDSKLKKVDAGEFRGGGGAVSAVANGSDNRVVTFSNSDALNGEANLTFDGSTLTIAGVTDITDATDSSDATGDTGALRTEGGASIAKKLYVGTDLDVDGTANLDAVDIDGNVQLDGTLTVGVNDTGKDVKFYGATAGSYLEWDESEDRLNLVSGAYVNEAVPASDTPTTEDATVTLDLSLGNYHNIVLGANVTKFDFTNAKRGQKFTLRITQHASSAKTVGWTNVDSDTGGTAATVRWAGNITPTMSTSTSHTDVYGFLCTNNAGTTFDGFIIGQDLPD